MNKLAVIGLAVIGLWSCAQPEVVYTPSDERLPLVPEPVSVAVMQERLRIDKGVQIVAPPAVATTTSFLKKFLTEIGISESKSGTRIQFVLTEDSTLHVEGYDLTIDKEGIRLAAGTRAGLFYGVQTLMQMLESHPVELPYVKITDYPRFAYRGLHLDVGRHMFPPDFIKKYIDLLAHHKMNRFHWHLTEDQGWRIEIKGYPKLQEIAAYRKETVVGRATTATRKNLKDTDFDGERYGGYYTQEEIRDIVKYAKDRHVTIVPEIELPGHALAALSAYPNLGCTGGPYEAATTWGIFDDVFCAGKEETFAFLEGVMDEVVELFPGEYIHIGGDEAPKTRWQKCPHCKKRIKDEGLNDAHELQSYFIQLMEKYLNSKGRQIIGWDEILEGGLAPNATVMSWRGEEGGIAAAKQNHDVIMTPGNWCYFDYYQDSVKQNEPLAGGGYIPVSKVYEYEPIPPQLSTEEAKHILGAQGNVWTEYMRTGDHVEYMVYPRACALAEVVWSPKESRNFDDFRERLGTHLQRLNRRGVNFAKHILTNPEKVSTSGSN
jgi:hexosaminidase